MKCHLLQFCIQFDFRRTMRTNDSVITWLNKQLTNAKIRDPGFRMAPPPKNISHVLGAQSTPAMPTMQPSMATEQRNNMLVSSTPLQNSDNPSPLNAKGKENRSTDKSTDKNELDPKYLQPSRKQAGSLKHSNESGTKRKTAVTTPKQNSVYFNTP